jgi:hydroxymethylpyrimidine pyrophosphatase-like HAD family hydrolase
MRNHRPATRPAPAFPIGLIALDVDGTLVGDDLRLSDRTMSAIGEAVRRGVHVSLATGRPARSAVVFANRLGLRAPVIGHQGAVVRAMPRRPDPAGEAAAQASAGARGRVGRLMYHQPLAADVVRDAITWCREHGLDPHVNDQDRIMVWGGDPSFDDYAAYLGDDADIVPDLLAAIDRPMSKVIAVGVPPRPMELVAEARRVFAGRADVTVSHPRFLEFVAPGVSKGRAVAWLAHRAGVPMSRVLTAGDALNDLEMIGDAGHGVAMSTALFEVRRAARYIAGPVGEDGVAALLEALVLAPPEEAARSADRLAAEAAAARVDAATDAGSDASWGVGTASAAIHGAG